MANMLEVDLQVESAASCTPSSSMVMMPNVWAKHHTMYLFHLESALKGQLVEHRDPTTFWSDFSDSLCESCSVAKNGETFHDVQLYYRYLKTLDDHFKNTDEPTVFEPKVKAELRNILRICPIFFPKRECSSSGQLASAVRPGSMARSLNRSDLNSQFLDFLQPFVNDKTIPFKKVDQVISEFESMETSKLKLFLGMPLDLKIKEVKKVARRPLM